MNHILVVDDDPGVRRLSELVLKSAGYEVRSAENGLQALEMMEQETPRAIVLDLQMPIMDGRSFFQQIALAPERPPVMLLSAYQPEAAQKELGAESSLAKPFDPVELVERVQRLT
jgi:CheY-like chemotaxis protein